MSKPSNPVRGPINSWVFHILDNYMDHLFGPAKQRLFENHPSTVVEIGAGTGANMRYLKKGTKLIAIEPNEHMHARLKKNALKYGIDLEIKALIGEAIDLPDNSCDFVASTLVLCTVDDPQLCVDQIKRVLKPSGQFVFIEHVKAAANTWVARIQNMIHRPWHWFFEGCHVNRNTRQLLESAGFSRVEIEAYNLHSLFVPITPQIRGRAIK